MELLKEKESLACKGGAATSIGGSIVVLVTGIFSAILGFIDGFSNPIRCNGYRSYYNW